MAKTKRLNESQNPVINGGIADDFHKIIIPQNTTVALSKITPKDVGSMAYDTTLNQVVVQTGAGFTVVGGGASGANQTLSNLTAPTVINQDLVLDTGGPGTIKTKDDTSTLSLTIQTGEASAGDSGSLFIHTGTVSSANSSGLISITSGATEDGFSGPVFIVSGDASGTGSSNNISLITGEADSGNSGNINLSVGGSVSGDMGSILMTALFLLMPQQTTDPIGTEGAIYYNTTLHKIRWHNGTVWASLA